MDTSTSLYIPSQPFVPNVNRPHPADPKGTKIRAKEGTQKTESFDKVFESSVKEQEKVQFSAHAVERAQLRNISLDERQLARLDGGVEAVSDKGSREALVLIDNVAAVVSVDNKMVITIADTNTLKQNIFTNIDSAVIV